ncbi:hypothetical protein EPK99_22600 [Neorhizobium lilium]|uniref:MBL fold metallo-hydrolase n=1 Tax=Neorhizobium lilium TaxID=2503024 RepID=A0A444LB21_9HYPH|nr:hypothetical protein [Neorhizobium lilium]RWX74706.1 hypothetical protein EPK99_22600 [Neorhizobium lilium]
MKRIFLAGLFVSSLCFVEPAYADLQATITARQKVFGVEHIDPKTGDLPKDKVLFSWISNSTFAAAIEGRIIYLDTYVTRLEVESGRTPIVIKDMVDLAPQSILLGHGHGDHADNAAYIAGKTGARIYATAETCGVMVQDLQRMQNDPAIMNDAVAKLDSSAKIDCVSVTSAGSTPGTEILQLDVLEPNACVIAFRHLHSVAVPPDTSFPPTPVKIILDPRDAELFPKGVALTPDEKAPSPATGQMNLETAGKPGGGESLFFSFILRSGSHFSFVWHNSAGALKEGKGQGWDGTPEDGRRIVAILKALPPTDLHMGTASSGNFTNNGLRDLIQYQEALKPKIYIPNHLTTGTATREASSMSVYAGYLKQLDLMNMPREQRPVVRWLIDPTDYLKPIVFDTADAIWENPKKAGLIDHLCKQPGGEVHFD